MGSDGLSRRLQALTRASVWSLGDGHQKAAGAWVGTTTSCVVRRSTFSRRIHSAHLLFRGDPATSCVSVRTLGLAPSCASFAAMSRPLARSKPARPTDLAESIPPSARRLLTELGMDHAVDAAAFQPWLDNTRWWAGEPARVERFADDAAGGRLNATASTPYAVANASGFLARLLEGMPDRGCTAVTDALLRPRKP